MAATALVVPPLALESLDDFKSPRTVAVLAAARVPLPPTPGRPGAGAASPPQPKPPKAQKKTVARPAQPKPQQPAARPAKATHAAALPMAFAALWPVAKPALLRAATYAGTLIFWLCFTILAGVSRLVNALTGAPAWNEKALAEAKARRPPPDAQTCAARAAEVARLLRLHGDGSLSAATTINPEFEWFIARFDAPHTGIDGALAWCDAAGYGRRVAMAVGDPLADRADWPALAAAFCAAHPGRAQFWHASADFAAVLDKQGGFFVNDFGAETVIDLREFNFGGRAKKLKVDIKAALARCDIREVTELSGGERAALAGLTGAWVGRKAVSDRRLRCFARAIDWETVQLGEGGGHARLFVATAKQAAGGTGAPAPTPITPATLDAFVLCDPLWKGGRIVGYCPAVSQAREAAHHGTIKALYAAAMDAARADLDAAARPGAPPSAPAPALFTLGLSPVYDLSAEVYRRARLLRDAHLFLRTCGNGLYAYQAVGGAKARWGGAGKGVPGVSSPHVYIAQPTWAPWTLELLDMWVCLRFTGIGRGVNATAAKLLGWGEGGSGGKAVEEEECGESGARSARSLAA